MQTPLLVPSFSSKGFRVDKDERSEAASILENTAEVITEAMLISAYDVHHKYLPSPEEFPSTPELMFVDSGGYETADEHDFSAVFRHTVPVKEWNENLYKEIIKKWPAERFPAVFVSFDRANDRKPLLDQIKQAKALFSKERKHLHALLMKPETKQQMYLTDALKVAHANIDELGNFHVIGMTEKELGKTILERMVNIAKLRRAMNGAKIDAPIHVFGALDPLSSCLYFISGAEIFDGLTWIRYAYHNGHCVYPHNYGALTLGINARENRVLTKMMSDNYYYLQQLQEQMKDFAATGDYAKLKPHEAVLHDAYDSLVREIGGGV